MRRNETVRDALARQHALESESVSLGAQRYRQTRRPWGDRDPTRREEASTAPGAALIQSAMSPVIDALDEWAGRMATGKAGRHVSAYQLLKHIPADAAAYIALRVAINSVHTTATMQAMATAIGRGLVEYWLMAKAEEEQPFLVAGIDKKLRTKQIATSRRYLFMRFITERVGASPFDAHVQQHAGLRLLDFVAMATGWFEVRSKRGKTPAYAPTAKLTDWLNQQHDRRSTLFPVDLPMIIPPRPWSSDQRGGYRVRQSNLTKLRHVSKGVHLDHGPRVYEAINHVQSTPWRINRDLLEVFEHVWREGLELGGLPPRILSPIPARPADADHNPEIDRAWRERVIPIHEYNATLPARQARYHQLFWIAKRFADEDAIFFPHAYDWRGRAYPLPSTAGPHPQGADINRALLEFAEGKPLGEAGADWLAVHLAGLFDHDKLTRPDRIAWARINANALADCGRDPYAHRWWTTTDKPWTTLAACIAWAGYCDHGAGYVCRLPIPVDATSSGLQHFSALLRDEIGGAAVNLIPADKPQDIYLTVSAKCEAINEDQRLAGRFLRKLTKPLTMTYVYAAKYLGQLKLVREAIHAHETATNTPFVPGLTGKEASNLITPVIREAISTTIVSARNGMDWLQRASKLFTGPIEWKTPAGFHVHHKYVVSSKYVLSIYVGPQKRNVQLKFADDKPDAEHNKRTTASAISANYIHSLDASHLMFAAVECRRQAMVLSPVHDSFASHPADMDRLHLALRQTFVEQYRNDVLADLRGQFIDQLPDALHGKIPHLPSYGNLDINVVLSSQYLFN